ncbi:MAG: MarR family transcriptional regulator [Pseudomonadota bacterium]
MDASTQADCNTGESKPPRETISTTTVADLVRKHPGQTSAELAAMTGLDRMMIARRLPEAAALKKGPTVFKGATRKCNHSGRPNSITWWPMPTPQ